MESVNDLTGLATVVLTALGCGMVMAHFRQPAMVGYLLAGMLLGPTGFAFVENRGLITALAELGVLLLLFVVGMELSVRALKHSWRLVLTAVAMQTAATVAVMLAVSTLLGFSLAASVLLGFVVALSSTAVSVKMLEEIGALRSRVGRITVAVLIAQDLAFLPMMLLVRHLGGDGFGVAAAFQIVLAVALLVVLVAILAQRRRIELPFARIVVGHADLSPLSGLVYCFGAGALFGLMGLPAAFGAFIAGLAIGNSAQRKQMLSVVRPIQSVLVMVFFLSIGLLVDLAYIWDSLGTVLLLLLIVTLFKTTLNIAIYRMLNETWPRAFLEGVVISQLGEFSFLLAATGLAVGTIGPGESRLVVAVTVLSLMLSPLWLSVARRFQRVAAQRIATLHEMVEITYGPEAARVRAGTGRLRAWLLPAAMGLRARLRRDGTDSQAVDAQVEIVEPEPVAGTVSQIGEEVRAAARTPETEAETETETEAETESASDDEVRPPPRPDA
jgi:CPA2 family monovalent cation:H+ antiporter-2